MLDELPDDQQSCYEWWELVPLAADPSRLPKLPIETWERILDECEDLDWYPLQDRARTFRACCSTCQAWLPRSRYHLYKHVTVRSKEHVKQVSKLLHSIPALRTRVKKLFVYGSNDGKRDASWFGLVGFHLGSKLKALKTIRITDVHFAVMKLDAYTFWGAFNRAWRPDTTRGLYLEGCTVTHLNQLIRLAFVTKAESLKLDTILPSEQVKPAPLAPVLSSGISLPLSSLDTDRSISNLVLSMPWHNLTKQCPSLSSVNIGCQDESLDLSSPDGQLLLVSILCMLHRMQQHDNTNFVRVQTDSLPMIGMRTGSWDERTNAGNTPPATQLRLRRDLVLFELFGIMESFVKALTLVEDATVLANYTNRRFHHIRIANVQDLGNVRLHSFQPLDDILSRLIATHDVHVIVEDNRYNHEGCIVPWAKERFPMLTTIVPNAFCDPEAGQPCDSHLTQASGAEQG